MIAKQESLSINDMTGIGFTNENCPGQEGRGNNWETGDRAEPEFSNILTIKIAVRNSVGTGKHFEFPDDSMTWERGH